MRYTRREAVDYAREHGLRLRKFADPTEDARDDVTPEEAEDVLREDPGLIYVDSVPMMIHTVSGHNFHGPYRIRLRLPAEGGLLSERQARKVRDILCGLSGCDCGGSLRYGSGPDWRGGARIVEANVAVPYGTEPWPLALVPAGSPGTVLDRIDPEWELLADVVVA